MYRAVLTRKIFCFTRRNPCTLLFPPQLHIHTHTNYFNHVRGNIGSHRVRASVGIRMRRVCQVLRARF